MKEQLIKYLEEQGSWINKTSILEMPWYNAKTKGRHSPETVARSLRLAEEECLIAVKYGEKGFASYHFLPEKDRFNYIPLHERAEGKEHLIWKTQTGQKIEMPKKLTYVPVYDEKGRQIAVKETYV